MTNEIEQPGGDGPPRAGEATQDRPAADPPGTQAFGADGATAAPPTAGSIAAAIAEPGLYVTPGRPRGLNAFFAPGGEDEASDERRADERRNLRLLLLMVAALVLIPTLLTIVAFAQELVAHGGG